MATMSCSKEATGSTSTPLKGLAKISDRQLKQIADRLKGDTDRQLLVLDYLDDLDGVEKAKKKRKRVDHPAEEEEEEDFDSDSPGFEVPADTVLTKHAMKYSGWRKNLCLELLSYCEPKIFNPTKKPNIDSVVQSKRFIEFGFCIVVLNEDNSDRPMTKNKKEAFERLRRTYIDLGRRLRHLNLQNVRTFDVDWAAHGVYEVLESRAGATIEVELTDKFAQKAVKLPSEWLQDCPKDYFTNDKIQQNWSAHNAFIRLPSGEEMECHGLFPKLKRALTRKLSDEHGVAAPPGGGEGADGKGDGKGGNGKGRRTGKGLLKGALGRAGGAGGGRGRKGAGRKGQSSASDAPDSSALAGKPSVADEGKESEEAEVPSPPETVKQDAEGTAEPSPKKGQKAKKA